MYLVVSNEYQKSIQQQALADVHFMILHKNII